MSIILSVENLCKNYGNQRVLNDVSFQVEGGDIIGLIGENGAGKSTLINIMSGVNYTDNGDVHLASGVLISDRVKYHSEICTAFDQSPFYQHLTGLQNMKMYTDDTEEAVKFLSICGLEDAKNKRVSTYSLGMKQRLNIARAFMMWNSLTIMDEPINGLDPGAVTDIKQYISEECDGGKAALISSHALKELLFFCNKFIFIHKGNIIAEIDSRQTSFEAFDKSANTEGTEIIKWLDENDIDYVHIPKISRVYFSSTTATPEEIKVGQIKDGTNILEDIYLRMRRL